MKINRLWIKQNVNNLSNFEILKESPNLGQKNNSTSSDSKTKSSHHNQITWTKLINLIKKTWSIRSEEEITQFKADKITQKENQITYAEQKTKSLQYRPAHQIPNHDRIAIPNHPNPNQMTKSPIYDWKIKSLNPGQIIKSPKTRWPNHPIMTGRPNHLIQTRSSNHTMQTIIA